MSGKRKLSVVGLGYVGLPVAVSFGRNDFHVIAFDIDDSRIAELTDGYDRTNEITPEELAAANIKLTSNATNLESADFHIVTVPTPIDKSNKPDLTPLLSATRTIGGVLKKGDIVVYESTVYPGATEEDCVPLLEQISGLAMGKDFAVGYSPERINPGDKEHRFETIRKVVSASDKATLDIVAAVYGSVVDAGVHQAPTIRTAEAAKVIENTQRDLNIALMNELAMVFSKLGIDTHDVLAAAGTKWNFLPFVPGLVGGHCIGVDPFYLTHRAQQAGYLPEVILAGRRINDSISDHIAQDIMKLLMQAGTQDTQPIVTVLGVTFKENVPDVRNSKIEDLVAGLVSFGAKVQVVDPVADPSAVTSGMNLELMNPDELLPSHCVVVGVPHREFVAGGWSMISSLLLENRGVVYDIKSKLDRTTIPDGVLLRRL